MRQKQWGEMALFYTLAPYPWGGMNRQSRKEAALNPLDHPIKSDDDTPHCHCPTRSGNPEAEPPVQAHLVGGQLA
ncbi:MAG: hypothetical protein ACE5NG_04440 [bacterium]